MKKLFVGNLPSSAKEQEINDLFSQYGKVRSIKIATDIFTQKCKGFGFIEMEGHEARAAIAGLKRKRVKMDKNIKVNFEVPKKKGRR